MEANASVGDYHHPINTRQGQNNNNNNNNNNNVNPTMLQMNSTQNNNNNNTSTNAQHTPSLESPAYIASGPYDQFLATIATDHSYGHGHGYRSDLPNTSGGIIVEASSSSSSSPVT